MEMEITKEEFFQQMKDFEETAKEIELLLEEKDYELEVKVWGLAGLIRALAKVYGGESAEAIIDTAAYMLTRDQL